MKTPGVFFFAGMGLRVLETLLQRCCWHVVAPWCGVCGIRGLRVGWEILNSFRGKFKRPARRRNLQDVVPITRRSFSTPEGPLLRVLEDSAAPQPGWSVLCQPASGSVPVAGAILGGGHLSAWA